MPFLASTFDRGRELVRTVLEAPGLECTLCCMFLLSKCTFKGYKVGNSRDFHFKNFQVKKLNI